jgi:hypothetical protein
VAALLASLALAAATPAAGQPELAVEADLAFYGDNTEFSNPFREGETLLGVHGRLVVEARVSDRVSVSGGVFGNQRFGSTKAFEDVRPVFSLVIGRPRSRLVLGTLLASRHDTGPDRVSPHGLLPPLQAETFAFTRPWEAGIQWIVDQPALRQDAWLNWQRLNTPRARERFDTGVVGEVRLRGPIAASYQWHLVHTGGQLYASGPVSDSLAVAAGPVVSGPFGATGHVRAELHALVSRHVPDREHPARSRTGGAGLLRLAVERGGWRAHALVFRGCDVIKVEGDPNYLSVRLDGSRFRRIRDYAEAGLARRFIVAEGVTVDASVRAHRVENHYEYSYRLLGRVRLRWPL